MSYNNNKKICFVGAGTMGCYNALVAALAGYKAVLNDRDADCLKRVPVTLAAIAEQLAPYRGLSNDQIASALNSISTEFDLVVALAGSVLVSESIQESLTVKQLVHGELDKLCDENIIITTNTSTLLPSDIESTITNRSRFAAMHSYLASPLVDIVGGSETSRATIEALVSYVDSLGGVPLVMKQEYPGYGLNALLGPLLGMSLGLVLAGDHSVESIDRAWIYKLKAPMGPFGMMDLFGLDMVCDSWRNRHSKNPDDALATNVIAYFDSLFSAGKLGMKSGRGFYDYPAPAYATKGFAVVDQQTEMLFSLLMVTVSASACLLVLREIMTISEVDMCWTVGTGLGLAPFDYIRQQGSMNFLVRLRGFQSAAPLMPIADFNAVVTWLESVPNINKKG
ncbi:MAG: 3-hydroxyacyl-CoA dehydrogenase [Arenicella sp.]|jgi:3-hydroxyacyl-CoA dehydrogenase